MSYDETLSITTAILQKHVDANRTIRPNDHIQNDLGLDSLGVMGSHRRRGGPVLRLDPERRLGDIATVEDIAKALVKLKS